MQEMLEAEEARTEAMYDSFRREGRIELLKELLPDAARRLEHDPSDLNMKWLVRTLVDMLEELQAV
jgi:hypothetical protein